MKTALKLGKKELASLYEKSSQQVKASLRTEFGEDFFNAEELVLKPGIITKEVKKNPIKKKQFINWEAISDFTPIFRMIGYAYLLWLIF